jgi:hypothetical protein
MIVSDRIAAYDILEQRPEGAGLLCLATTHDGRAVLVRLVAPSGDEDESARARLLGELHRVALARHRNLVDVLDVVEDPAGVGLVTEVLEGETLEHAASKGGLEWRDSLDVAAQVVAGLRFAHACGLAHGRLRPDQVCVTADGTAKILNIGLGLVERLVAAPSATPDELDAVDEKARVEDLRGVGPLICYAITGRLPASTAGLQKALTASPARAGSAPGWAEICARLADVLAREAPSGRNRRDGHSYLAALGRELLAARLTLEAPVRAAASAPVSVHIESEPTVAEPAPNLTMSRAKVRSEAGPAELGTLHVPMPIAERSAGPHGVRDGMTWLMVAGVGVLAIASAIWFARPDATAVPPRSLAPPTWTLSIDSDPQQATVTVDGAAFSGTTPLDVPVPAGTVPRIEIRLDGYKPRVIPITPTVEFNGRVHMVLEPVSEPLGAFVQVVARGDYRFELLQGERVVSPAAREHRLSVRAGQMLRARSLDYYFNRSYRVPSEGLDLTVPPLATVHVVAPGHDNCGVSIGNLPTGVAPDGSPISVPAGSYQIVVQCPDRRRPRTKTVTIRADQSNEITFAADSP